jgi:hypothetical protein
MPEQNVLEYAGQIDIQHLKLISSITGIGLDLDDYLVEINIFEDIFNNFLYGQLMIADSRNLVNTLPIMGEEYLIVKMSTPTLNSYFDKTFRVYSITDRKTVRDNNTQTYILHFCSMEAIVDINTPLFKSFKGKISDVVGSVYRDFLEIPRTYEFGSNGDMKESDYTTPLYLLNETENTVKFISPGWTASKCLNWLASKSIPEKGSACDFLFWESTKAFYFGNIEKIYSDALDSGYTKGTYFYFPPNSMPNSTSVSKMFIAEDFEVIRTVDNLKNYNNGYLSNRLITLDLYSKKYEVKDFDYVESFYNYNHTNYGLGQARPLFATNTIRNPASHNKFYPINKKLFTDSNDNVNERIIDIHGNRTSRLIELTNFNIQITVPGRTDLEVGSMIEFIYPDTTEKFSSIESGIDNLYSGFYLITAIRHKINMKKHVMIMELTKDSLENTENAD